SSITSISCALCRSTGAPSISIFNPAIVLQKTHDETVDHRQPASGPQFFCDPGPLDEQTRIAALQRDLVLLQLNDLTDYPASRHHFVAGAQGGEHLPVPLLLPPLRKDQQEIEDCDDEDQLNDQ